MLTDSLNTRAFAWTADSRLATLTATTGNESYTYSAFGTRAKVGTRTFLRAGVGVTASVLDDGNAKYTPGVSEVRSGTTTYSHSGLKHMGAQSGSGGSVAATNTYDAFGGVSASSGSWQGPFGAAGVFGYQTETSALHLLGHRYYEATLGRFLTRDPIGDGSNWYAYCDNEPTALADPTGLLTKGARGTDLIADGDHIDYRFGNVDDAVDRAIIDGIETGFSGLGSSFSLGLWQPDDEVRARPGYSFSVGAGNVALAAGSLATGGALATLPGVGGRVAARLGGSGLARGALRKPDLYHNAPRLLMQIVLREGDFVVKHAKYVVILMKGAINGKEGTFEVGLRLEGWFWRVSHWFFDKSK